MASDLEKKESFIGLWLTHVKNVSPVSVLLTAVLTIVGYRPSAALGLPTRDFVGAAVVVGAALTAIFAYLRQHRAPLGFPLRYLFNYLPAPTGRKREKGEPLGVLIIGDDSVAGEVRGLVDRYASDKRLKIEKAIWKDDNRHWGEDVLALLSKAGAVLGFLTSSLHDSGTYSTVVEDWALENPDKPVVIVNMEPETTYDLTFDHISPSSIQTGGITQLLVRGVERAAAWRRQAADYWAVAGILLLGIALLVMFVLWQRSVIGDMETRLSAAAKREDPLKPEIFNTLFDALKRNRTQPGAASSAAEGPLQAALDMLHGEIVRGSSEKVEFVVATFWLKENGVFRMIAHSKIDGELSQEPITDASVLGCAVRNTAFVLWSGLDERDDLSSSMEAWALDDALIERAQGQELKKLQPCVFNPKIPSAFKGRRTDILCFGKDARGICIDEARSSRAGFLAEGWIRKSLMIVFLAMIPLTDQALGAIN